jgi:hypothetical protein
MAHNIPFIQERVKLHEKDKHEEIVFYTHSHDTGTGCLVDLWHDGQKISQCNISNDFGRANHRGDIAEHKDLLPDQR